MHRWFRKGVLQILYDWQIVNQWFQGILQKLLNKQIIHQPFQYTDKCIFLHSYIEDDYEMLGAVSDPSNGRGSILFLLFYKVPEILGKKYF